MWLSVRSGERRGETIELNGRPLVIGRDDECDLVLDDEKASRRHAVIEPAADGKRILRDLGSRNGTFVNSSRVERAVLVGREQIQIGDTVLVSSPDEPRAARGETVLGSAVHRLRLQRSLRRVTVLAAAAIVVAAAGAALLLSGVVGSEDAVERAVEAAAPATVFVEAVRGGARVQTGSGFVLDAGDGLIVTNAHVLNGGTSFRAGAPAAPQPATVVGVAPCEDLAVLKVRQTRGLRALPLGDQGSLQLGETVVAVGYPANASEQAKLTSTSGVVSVARTAYREPTLDVPPYSNVVQTDAAINPGSSGGPLVDLDGRLVGVNAAGRTTAPDGRIIQGQSYAIGVDRVKQVVGVLRTGRSIGWAGLGFEYAPDGQGSEAGLVAGPPVPGTGAARAGLAAHEGAIVTAVNGVPLDGSLASYCDAVSNLRSGDRATFALRSGGGSRADVAVTLE